MKDLGSPKAKAEAADPCTYVGGLLEDYLLKQKDTKMKELAPCGEEEACGCGSEGSVSRTGKVDLIILVDTSGSMSRFAAQVSSAAERAIENAKEKCPTDLRLLFMGVEGTWGGTRFTTNHLAYLQSLDPTVTFATHTGHSGLASEEGANAVQDLSDYFDWREGACRAIFYVSDEELGSSRPRNDLANETAVTNAAIAAAKANKVTVFAHHITHLNRAAQILQNYQDLCTETGGLFYSSRTPDEDEYVKMLSEAICKSCGTSKCKTADVPDLKPCISISWGDSDCDCIETDDLEVMQITVCNCYDNVTFENFSIGYLYVTDEDGKTVPTLPDGSLSVEILPVGPYCFGDIGPCVDGEPTCKSRQFVMATRGSKAGKYKISVGVICYDVSFHYSKEACFEFDLCKS